MMIKRDVAKIDTSGIKQRQIVQDICDFVESDDLSYGKVLVLFGLRRTGKTTMLEQVISKYRETEKCAFYELTDKDNMDTVIHAIINEQVDDTKIVCIDEITKATDFITNSSLLPDIFAKEGMTIIVAGTDSLGFVFAEDRELYDRTRRVRTTHIPFAEHCEVLGIDDIDDYIMYGGLMRKGLSEKQIYSYETARKYLDSAVSDNISLSIKNDPHDNMLKSLSNKDIRTIIEKMVELYSGIFDKVQIQNELSNVSVNYILHKIAGLENVDVIRGLKYDRNNIAKDFARIINAEHIISTEITDEMIKDIERYLIDMDLLSVINKNVYSFALNFDEWDERKDKEYYIIQPAIKYYHLQKAKDFISEEHYYKALSQSTKEYLQQKLDEQIKGLMTEQIIAFDVNKMLGNDKYYVFKPEFYIDGQKRGEFDIVIYDKISNKHWLFEIKHTDNRCEEQEKYLKNETFCNVMAEYYGELDKKLVLYRGENTVAESGVLYMNITYFLKRMDESKNVSLLLEDFIKEIHTIEDISPSITKK